MDFLKAEIARKKRQVEEQDILTGDKKYFKRGDLAAKQEEEYWRKHKRLKSVEEQSASTSQVADEDAVDTPDSEKHQLSRKEVIKRLRERSEPIRLFSESDYEAYQRLKKLEMLQPEVIKGFNNDMKTAMEQVDQEYLNEILKSTGSDSDHKSSYYVKVKDTSLTLEEILKKAEGLGKGDEALDCDVILNFLKLILKGWGEDLNCRESDDKRGFRGKLASATHSQTVAYIKPLFRKLKQRKVSSDILGCLVDIIQRMLDREYLKSGEAVEDTQSLTPSTDKREGGTAFHRRCDSQFLPNETYHRMRQPPFKANDAYLEMAIGNAPWPIGVTMVGIHARTGREKIFARNVAHVLNDETQRKYIQALKRLITQCQKLYPTDPSRSVDFESMVQ